MNLVETIVVDTPAFVALLKETLNASDPELAELDCEHSLEIDGTHIDLELVDCEGGREGEGERVARVLSVDISGYVEKFYIRTTGYYDSYNGTEWSGEWERVLPREVTVIQYFPA